MADGWKLESVHEQFDVFDNINEGYNQINISDLAKTIRTVTNDHLRVTERPSVPEEDLFSTIIRNTDKGQHIVISYIVIVTNEDVGNKLCKVPVFIILSTNQKKFIDLNSVVYDSWDAFMETNSLPACEYCYPINGEYNVEGNLIIHFGSTPAEILRRKKRQFLRGILISGALIAGSILFKIPFTEVMVSCVSKFISKAERFLDCNGDTIKDTLNLVIIIQSFCQVTSNRFLLLKEIWDILQRIHNRHEQEITAIWNDIKHYFRSFYESIQQLLKGMFESASNSSRDEFVAIAFKIQTELDNIDSHKPDKLTDGQNVTVACYEMAAAGIYDKNMFSSSKSVKLTGGCDIIPQMNALEIYDKNMFSSKKPDKFADGLNTTVSPQMGPAVKCDMNMFSSGFDEYVKSGSDLFNQRSNTGTNPINKLQQSHVLDMSKEDHKLDAKNKKQSLTQKGASSASENNECKLHKRTEDLLLISKQLLNQFQLTALDDLQDIFETISCIARDQYKLLMDKYCNLVSDAKECNGGKIDIDKFNGSLGINGDPKFHYWNEVLNMIQNPNQITVIKEKIREFTKQKKMFMIPIWRKSEDSKTGLFKFVGIKRAGKLPARAFVGILKENSINIDIDNLAIYETDSNVIIRYKEYIITIYQDVNEDNTPVGLVFVASYSDLFDNEQY